jgi:sugar lactone lactonase YvrE
MPSALRVETRTTKFTLAIPLVAALAMSGFRVGAQAGAPPNSQPNPYRTIENWFKLPEPRTWGSSSAIDIDREGNIWIAERCGANTCAGKADPPVLKFDASGKLLKSFGEGLLLFPHYLRVDKDGNIWVVDGIPPGAGSSPGNSPSNPGKGHQAIKFSPEGKVLMTLGKAGVPGDGPDTFNQPSGIAIAPNGDIFVADGHGGNSNARIVKFTRDGKFIKTWGKKGTAQGEFDTPHALAFDSKGRLFVADRANDRIQIFDQEGKFLDEWKQFSRPSGLSIDRNDIIYVSDSESRERDGYGHHPGWKRGIRVGSARDGTVTAFIPDTFATPEQASTSGAEGVAADASGVIYGAEVGQKDVKRYVKK